VWPQQGAPQKAARPLGSPFLIAFSAQNAPRRAAPKKKKGKECAGRKHKRPIGPRPPKTNSRFLVSFPLFWAFRVGANARGGTSPPHRAKRGPPVQIFHARPYELSHGIMPPQPQRGGGAELPPPRPLVGGRGGETPTVRLRRPSAAARHLRSGGAARRRRKRGLRPPQDLPPRIGGVGGASPPTTTNSASGPPSTSPCSSTAPPPRPLDPKSPLLFEYTIRSLSKKKKEECAGRFAASKHPIAPPSDLHGGGSHCLFF
jgi:hypothetical protein